MKEQTLGVKITFSKERKQLEEQTQEYNNIIKDLNIQRRF